MDACAIRKEIKDLQNWPLLNREPEEDHHQKLLELFITIDKELNERWGDADGAEAEEKIAGLIEAQTVIMQTSACLKAKSMRDLYYKMALWRRDMAGLDAPMQEMSRTTAIAYSVYKDIAELVRQESKPVLLNEKAS